MRILKYNKCFSQDQKEYCLWGGETYGITEAQDKTVGKNHYRKPVFMGIRMFHPNMKSWSLIADFRDFAKELSKFKNHVQLKRYSIGFVSGRSAIIHQVVHCDDGMQLGNNRTVESSEIMTAVKASFPNTLLYGGFNLGMSIIYGYNSTGDSEYNAYAL